MRLWEMRKLQAVAANQPFDPDADSDYTFVGWIEPPAELSQRLWAAWDRWTARLAADRPSIKRVDETFADTQVIRLSRADGLLPHGNFVLGAGVNSNHGVILELSVKSEEKPLRSSDYHLLVARIGNRILLVHNLADEARCR